jgi:hypothetical protein
MHSSESQIAYRIDRDRLQKTLDGYDSRLASAMGLPPDHGLCTDSLMDTLDAVIGIESGQIPDPVRSRFESLAITLKDVACHTYLKDSPERSRLVALADDALTWIRSIGSPDE